MVQHHFGLFWRKIKPLGRKISALDAQWRHLALLDMEEKAVFSIRMTSDQVI
ncbi:MAG: hypothetical protein AB7E46_14855 [Desulfovibrio sp.]|jgi:hypothetical protein